MKLLHTQDVLHHYMKTHYLKLSHQVHHNLVTEKTLKPLLYGKPFLIWLYFTLRR